MVDGNNPFLQTPTTANTDVASPAAQPEADNVLNTSLEESSGSGVAGDSKVVSLAEREQKQNQNKNQELDFGTAPTLAGFGFDTSASEEIAASKAESRNALLRLAQNTPDAALDAQESTMPALMRELMMPHIARGVYESVEQGIQQKTSDPADRAFAYAAMTIPVDGTVSEEAVKQVQDSINAVTGRLGIVKGEDPRVDPRYVLAA